MIIFEKIKGVHRNMHCNENLLYIFLFWDSAASAPISTFMCLWAIYIVPGSVYIFPPAVQGDRSWEYINRSHTHECGNWDWGPDILFWEYLFRNFGLLSLLCGYKKGIRASAIKYVFSIFWAVSCEFSCSFILVQCSCISEKTYYTFFGIMEYTKNVFSVSKMLIR